MDRINGFLRRRRPGLTIAFLAVVLLVPSTQAAKEANKVSPETLALHPEVMEMHQQIAAAPEDARLQAALGNMYAQRGWDDLAIASYLEALTLDETLYEAWTNLGTIYNRQENLPKAEKSFRNAIDLQPRAALAYYNLGTVLDRSDRYDEALAAYKTAITYDPTLLDPAINPQVVNNQHLTSIRLMSYLESAGSGALPLEEFTEEMESMLEEAEAVEDEAAPPAPEAQPVGSIVPDPTAGLRTYPGTSNGKPVLGTLHADVKKESWRAKRKRRKQEQAPPQAEPGTPAP